MIQQSSFGHLHFHFGAAASYSLFGQWIATGANKGTLYAKGGFLCNGTAADVNVGLGYSATAAASAIQATSKSTGVTANGLCGNILVNNAALAANTTVLFTFTNSLIVNSDIILLSIGNSPTPGAYQAWVSSVGTGSCVIAVRNLTGGSLSEQIPIRFSIFRAGFS